MSARNGSYDRVPRLVKELACFGGKHVYFQNNSSDIGPTYDRSTLSPYARLTGRFYVTYPMIVSALIWDVRTADEYICRFTTTVNGTTSLFDVNTSVVVGAPGAITITPTNGDFLLLPGPHYLQLATHDAATVQWWDKNAAFVDYTYYWSRDCYYTTGINNYTIPVRLTARPAVLANMTEYVK